MAGQFWSVFVLLSMVYLCKVTAGQTCSTEFVESTTCGGNIIGDSGIIRYNHTGYGRNSSGCFWLIRSNINSNVEVRLLADTFTDYDVIHIYQLFLDGEIGGLPGSHIRHGDYASRQFSGPVILIKFSTYEYNYAPTTNSTAVPSFTLLYRGCGPEITNPPTFSHFYREKVSGEMETVTYPSDGELYPSNQLITFLGLRQDRAILRNHGGDWKINVRFQDMQPSSYCLFGDALKFYNGGFNMLCSVDDKDDFIWRFCQRNSNETYVVPTRSSKYGNIFPDTIGILAVFASNSRQGGKGFIFEW